MPPAFDFRAQQRRAGRQSVVFVLLFAVMVLLVTVVTALGFNLFVPGVSVMRPAPLTLPLGFIVLSVILLAAAYKAWRLGGDGASVATALGASEVPADTRNLYQMRYLNILEETAIAAGMPVPRAFVMRHENGINAFAAGAAPDHAAVAVTHGALAKLTREELAGVIAHEMAHIRNSDIRLNTNLLVMVFGLAFLYVKGREMLGVGEDPRDAKPFVFAIVCVVTGYLGALGGRLLQSALSRRREYLADATAVEFTRNPAGLAAALKKIAGTQAGSRVRNPHSEEARHMFFARISGSRSRLFASHPPITERIRALDPTYDPATDPLLRQTEKTIRRSTRSELVAEMAERRGFNSTPSAPRRAAGPIHLPATRGRDVQGGG